MGLAPRTRDWALLAATVVLCQSAFAATPLPPKHAFPPLYRDGKAYRIDYESICQMGNGTNLKTTFQFDVRCRKNSDKLELKYEMPRAAMEFSQEGKTAVTIDTDKPESLKNKPGRIVSAMKNSCGTATLDEKGLIASTKGLTDKFVKEFGLKDGPELQRTADEGARDYFSLIETFVRYLPRKPVAVGESWKSQLPVFISGEKMTEEIQCTLKQVKPAQKGQEAVISFDGKLMAGDLVWVTVTGIMSLDPKDPSTITLQSVQVTGPQTPQPGTKVTSKMTFQAVPNPITMPSAKTEPAGKN